MRTRNLKIWISCLLLLVPLTSLAQTGTLREAKDIKNGDTPFLTRAEMEAMSTDAFLSSHLDLKYLLSGREHYMKGDFKRAYSDLDRAAFYGDKLAQAMLAEMLWDGKGVAADRVRAYAMADVAAERMSDPFLLRIREQYWDALTQDERRQVTQIAPDILQRYSEAHTVPRMEQHWRKTATPQRAKGYGRLLHKIIAYNSNGGVVDDIRPDAFYAEKFWNSDEYRKFKDAYVEAAVRYGTVKVKFGGKAEDDSLNESDEQPLQP